MLPPPSAAEGASPVSDVGATWSSTTSLWMMEEGLLRLGITLRKSEVSMNNIAIPVVSLDKKLPGPRPPKKPSPPPAPNTPARSPPFPLWSSTTKMMPNAARIWKMVITPFSNVLILSVRFLLLSFFVLKQ